MDLTFCNYSQFRILTIDNSPRENNNLNIYTYIMCVMPRDSLALLYVISIKLSNYTCKLPNGKC